MWLLAVGLVMAFPGIVQAQQDADMFSCIDPGRLGPGALEYRSDQYNDQLTIAPVMVGDRRVIRATKRRMRDGRTTAEATFDLEAASLAPVAFRIMTAERGVTVDLAVQDDRLTGRILQSSVSASAGGRPVLIGTGVDDVLITAVDWGRCAAVTATTLGLNGTPAVISYARVGERALAISGREVMVYEVLRQQGESRSRLFVTKSVPFVLAKKEIPDWPDTELVALPK